MPDKLHQSAPVDSSSQNTAESDHAVTHDSAGADTGNNAPIWNNNDPKEVRRRRDELLRAPVRH